MEKKSAARPKIGHYSSTSRPIFLFNTAMAPWQNSEEDQFRVYPARINPLTPTGQKRAKSIEVKKIQTVVSTKGILWIPTPLFWEYEKESDTTKIKSCSTRSDTPSVNFLGPQPAPRRPQALTQFRFGLPRWAKTVKKLGTTI